MQPIVYLPIEVGSRELSSRLLMTANFLAAGFAVVLGNQWSLIPNLAALPHGLVFFKTMNKIQGTWMKGARAAGHLVAANDEEVLNFIDAKGYLLAFDPLAAANCDIFLAQSAAHARVIKEEFPSLGDKIHVVGNPRLDLLALRRIGKFRTSDPAIAAHKPYLLVNTNYGSINSIWGDDRTFYQVNKRAGAFDAPNSEQKTKEFWDIIAWEKQNYEAMRALLAWMFPRLSGIRIVIRPHPIERAGFWTEVASGYPNVTVIQKSEPHAWIMDAELVIHTGCTTGLEAAIMGRPTLNLLPQPHPIRKGLVELANPTFHDWEKAAAALKQFLVRRDGPIVDHDGQAAILEHLPSYRSADAIKSITALAAEALVKAGAMPLKAGNSFGLKAYQRTERPDLAKEKFSSSYDEFIAGLNWATQLCGNIAFRAQELDESAFLAVPA